jgi:hypothetical protein
MALFSNGVVNLLVLVSMTTMLNVFCPPDVPTLDADISVPSGDQVGHVKKYSWSSGWASKPLGPLEAC